MRVPIFVSVFRLLIAVLALAGTSETWYHHHLVNLVFFTHETNLAIAVVMIWWVVAQHTGLKKPPGWLYGMLVLNIVITALVANLILPAPDPAKLVYIFGVSTSDLVHKVVPALMVIDFLLVSPHHRYGLRSVLIWIAYFPIYIAFVLIRGQINPQLGPGPNGSSYPYFFMNPQIGWGQIVLNAVEYVGAFLVLGLLLLLLDRLLPQRSLLLARQYPQFAERSLVM